MANVNYTITIEPIMTNGDNDLGKYLTLGDGQRVDTIIFEILNGIQQTTLQYMGDEVRYYGENDLSYSDLINVYNPIAITKINVSNNIFSPIGQCFIEVKINSNRGKYVFSNPLCNLFRANDIIRISYTTENGFINDSYNPQLIVGTIEAPIKINSDIDGTLLRIPIGYLPNILARSQLVQTQSDSKSQGTQLTSILTQNFQFGNLLTQLIEETYISQTVTNTRYFAGYTDTVSEKIATGKPDTKTPQSTSGSAIGANSWVLATTPPTGSKLDCILQLLYPYQRVFYVSPAGDFTITPLSTFFDTDEDWSLNFDNDRIPSGIGITGVYLEKNTAVIQNRAYCTFNQLFTEFNLSTNAGNNASNAPFSIATPPHNIFPRAYDFVQSGLALQTLFDIEAIDGDAILQNSGLLNTAINIANGVDGTSGVVGMKSMLNIDNQNIHLTNSNTNLEWIKFLMSLYASRKLAESLLQDMLVNVTMPTVSTFNEELGRLRILPLNQMVQMFNVQNDNFDGLTELFCYGFSIEWSLETGSVTTLNLCKPYVFTALWADQLQEIT